jgi:hypothetical protein
MVHQDGSMRALPQDIDVEAVMAIGHYLDDHGSGRPVSIHGALSSLRCRLETPLSDASLEELLVEMCASRKLAVLFDRREGPPPESDG